MATNSSFAQLTGEYAIPQPEAAPSNGMQLRVSNGALGVSIDATARHIGAPSNSTAGSSSYPLDEVPPTP